MEITRALEILEGSVLESGRLGVNCYMQIS